MSVSFSAEFVELCTMYKLAVDKREIERKLFDFFNSKYNDKLDYKILVEDFRNQGIYDLMQKAKNVYIGTLVSDFLDVAISKGVESVISDYVSLSALCSASESSCIYGHYLKTSLSLAGDNFFIVGDSFVNNAIDEALENAGWKYKKSLYCSVIDEIVKLNSDKSKSTVVMISNQQENYFLNNLMELRTQALEQDTKIVFVSNCPSNQTKNVLDNVDTFIQLSGNYGDCLPRNIGALFGNSEIVIFVEDDGIPGKDFLRFHSCIHEEQKILSLRGCCLPISKGEIPPHYWLGMRDCIAPPVLEGNCSFELESFYKVGGWGDYLYFGHGGYEICYRMLKSFSTPEQHIYSSRPILYHDWKKPNNLLEKKQLRHHALWYLLRRKYPDFYKLPKLFEA